MAKDGNVTDSRTIRVTVSVQSEQLLEQLAAKGVYGRNPAEVAGRFIDEALRRFLEPLRLTLKTEPKRNRTKR